MGRATKASKAALAAALAAGLAACACTSGCSIADPAADLLDAIADSVSDTPIYTEGGYVMDELGAVGTIRKVQLEDKAEALSERYRCGVYILIVDDCGSRGVDEYAARQWVKRSLGKGGDGNGILLFIAGSAGEYTILTHGEARRIFSDYQMEQVEDTLLRVMSDRGFGSSLDAYLGCCRDALEFYGEHREPLNERNDPKGSKRLA